MAMGDLGRRIPGSRHKKGHEPRLRVSGQHGRSIERRDGVPQAAENLVGVSGRVVGVGKHTDLRVIVEEPKQAIGDVVDLKRVLIVLPCRIRGLRNGYAQVRAMRPSAWTGYYPSIGVSIEPYNRIAPDLGASTVRLVPPKSRGAYRTSQDIARFVINCDRGVDHLQVVIEANSPAVVGCIAAKRTIVAGRQFADMKPIEAHDWI